MTFPHFLIRDMVDSQHKLVTEHLGISTSSRWSAPRWAACRRCNGASAIPTSWTAWSRIVPLARTPAWTVTVLEATRKAIMLDPAWKNGDYAAPPEQGIRLWRDILSFLAARAPEISRDQFPNRWTSCRS